MSALRDVSTDDLWATALDALEKVTDRSRAQWRRERDYRRWVGCTTELGRRACAAGMAEEEAA